MPDLLVRLYDLPAPPPNPADELVRRAFTAEKGLVVEWIRKQFKPGWASEADAAFARLPVSCFIAVEDGQLRGFACYDATARGFFGPFGVAESARDRGLGRALLHLTLRDMRANGYAYAIIGCAAETDFYRNEVGATVIANSDPGPYRGMLRV